MLILQITDYSLPEKQPKRSKEEKYYHFLNLKIYLKEKVTRSSLLGILASNRLSGKHKEEQKLCKCGRYFI